MKGYIFVLAVSGFLTSTEGQCPLNVENISIDSCDGSTKNGPNIDIDFHKINRPCTCKVTSSFNGDLLVISREGIIEGCKTRVIVANYYNFGCPITAFSVVKLEVQINQSVVVQSEYSPPYISGSFYHCLGFQQNSGLDGNISVLCGSQLVAKTTSIKLPTTTATFTTRLLRPSSVVSSMEPTVSSSNSDITMSTAAILSAEIDCDHRIAESLLSLQIPLAVFVVISTVSTIFNIYFFIHIK
nr:uncharacterized protein LOC117691682 [Crassostrea gigas]XP_034334185.1 uncharacterized protein LOC117691682 [Crassostrea gigas]